MDVCVKNPMTMKINATATTACIDPPSPDKGSRMALS